MTLSHASQFSVFPYVRGVWIAKDHPVLRIGDQEAVGKVEGTEETGTFSCHQDLKPSGDLCPFPSAFSGQGSLSCPLAHLLPYLSLLR